MLYTNVGFFIVKLCKSSSFDAGDTTVGGVFGFNQTTPGDSKKFDVWSLAGTMNMAKSCLFLKNPPDVGVFRGINVKMYETCMPLETRRGTFKVTFYITGENVENEKRRE
jgi:hypothetical protein